MANLYASLRVSYEERLITIYNVETSPFKHFKKIKKLIYKIYLSCRIAKIKKNIATLINSLRSKLKENMFLIEINCLVIIL